MINRRIAVVTTFSKAGWNSYAERMVNSWIKHWPEEVDLYVYPDEDVPLPERGNVHKVLTHIHAKQKFLKNIKGCPQYHGHPQGATKYNYRFDAAKFCHKPFALWHCMHELLLPAGYDSLIWLDADTLTHTKVTWDAVMQMAPEKYDIQFLGRCYKYTECGYLYFNLKRPKAVAVLDAWVDFYVNMTFKSQKEWHDSFLYDLARVSFKGLRGKDLTGHIPRRQGAGHPLINSFLGKYLDHLKGDSRKATGAPRKGDLFTNHDSKYWKDNHHAKKRFKTKRRIR